MKGVSARRIRYQMVGESGRVSFGLVPINGFSVIIDDANDGRGVLVFVESGFGRLGAGAGFEPEDGGGGVTAGSGLLIEGFPDFEVAQFFGVDAEAEGEFVSGRAAFEQTESDVAKLVLHGLRLELRVSRVSTKMSLS